MSEDQTSESGLSKRFRYSALENEAQAFEGLKYFETFMVLNQDYGFLGKSKIIDPIHGKGDFVMYFEPEKMLKRPFMDSWEPNILVEFPYIYSRERDPFLHWMGWFRKSQNAHDRVTRKITREIDSKGWMDSLEYNDHQRYEIISRLLDEYGIEHSNATFNLVQTIFDEIVQSQIQESGVQLLPEQKRMLTNLALKMAYDKLHARN